MKLLPRFMHFQKMKHFLFKRPFCTFNIFNEKIRSILESEREKGRPCHSWTLDVTERLRDADQRTKWHCIQGDTERDSVRERTRHMKKN